MRKGSFVSMRTSLTKELEKYTQLLEAQASQVEKDEWRLKFHVMPPVGWLNDPNGLCYFNGEYHLFFQYSPSDPNGSLKYWGHYVSKNMLSWEYKGIALYPDMPFDCCGVYSGSALVEGDQVWLYYTGNVKLPGNHDYVNTGRQGNTIAVVMDKDGHMGDKQLVLTNEDYPADVTCHVRDPKVWKDKDRYYMVLGARKKGDKGCVLLYSSTDRMSWELANVLETEETFGFMWECPDFFCLDGHNVLSFSPQGLAQNGLDYANTFQSGYFMVRGEVTGAYTLENFREWDRGFDFYAPQTFETGDGRRILMGWMGMGESDYVNLTVERGWQHCLTLTRELSLKNGRVLQNPVRELEQYRTDRADYSLESGMEMAAPLCSDILMEELKDRDFHLCIDDGLTINYDKDKKIFTIEFLPESPISGGRTARGVALENLNSLRILLDTSAVEIYVNGGEEVFSSRMYPRDLEISHGHSLTLAAGSGKMTMWKLEERE